MSNLISFFSIVLIYAFVMLIITSIVVILRLLYLEHQQKQRFNFYILDECVDKHMNISDIVFIHRFSKQNYWRNVFDFITFENMKAEEYKKKL